MAETAPKSYSMDPTLWLYTSLTSGSSHIVTATSRMETILKANRVPFKALDIATDEKARMLWGRRAGKDESGRPRKIPGLVQMGMVVGDLVEVEEWNEYGELKQHVKIVPVPGAPVHPLAKPVQAPSTKPTAAQQNTKATAAPLLQRVEVAKAEPTSIALALRQAGQEAAQKAKESKNRVATKVFDDVSDAEPAVKAIADVSFAKEAGEEPAATLSPLTIPTVGATSFIQSPNSTAWKPEGKYT